jgi:hypothetical protein
MRIVDLKVLTVAGAHVRHTGPVRVVMFRKTAERM